jgi:hypothetical protein
MPGSRFNQALSDADVLIRLGIVALALSTAWIHSTLGGPLFTLNALGYLVGAAAMVVPVEIVARHRWLVRIGLAGYAATTITLWAVQGPFYSTAYVAKTIEVALIALLVVDFVRRDGRQIRESR